MNTKNKLKDLYFERKLEPIHSIHAILAQIERQLYQGGILSGQNLALPDFLGIGATKAGTTWLYQNLFAHPDIFMPTTKELHYFDRRFDEILYVYTRKFKDVKGKIKGEITPAYSILNIERIKFIHLLMPDVRLIFIMHNPIERAWSEDIHNLLRKDKRRSFEDVPNEEIENILNSDAIVSRSQYTQILDNWLSVFPAEQVLVLFYDDLKTNPETFLKSVFVHIGIGTDIDWKQLPYQQKFNVNPDTSIPEQFRTMLEQQYCQEIENLYQRFGEKLANWRCNSN